MFTLNPQSKRPIKQQLYTQLRTAILSTQLSAGEKLPPSRTLAEDLGISRNSVLAAYEQLTAEGYLVSRKGSGTFVADAVTAPPQGRHTPDASITITPSAYSRQITRTVPPALFQRSNKAGLAVDFAYGEPAYEDLPMETWARVVGSCARRLNQEHLGYGPHCGHNTLRRAIALYLARARGVHCHPEQVVIVQGTQEAIDLCVRLLVDNGDTVVLEDPHYRGFRRCLLAAQADIRAIAVDRDGIQTKKLNTVVGAKLACLTPSHQFPTGAVLPLQRRMAVLEWAAHNNTVILEDDYDGEFRYGQSPIPSLQSLDKHNSVIYVGTSSKIFFPALRIGWMVVPRPLLAPLTALKAMADIWPSTLEQLAFAKFINAGHLERHLLRARRRLAGKRQVLISELNHHLGHRIRINNSQAGIHLLLHLPTLKAEQIPELVEHCAANGTGVYPAAPFYRQQPPEPGLILGYASLNETQITTGVRHLAQALKAVAG